MHAASLESSPDSVGSRLGKFCLELSSAPLKERISAISYVAGEGQRGRGPRSLPHPCPCLRTSPRAYPRKQRRVSQMREMARRPAHPPEGCSGHQRLPGTCRP